MSIAESNKHFAVMLATKNKDMSISAASIVTVLMEVWH